MRVVAGDSVHEHRMNLLISPFLLEKRTEFFQSRPEMEWVKAKNVTVVVEEHEKDGEAVKAEAGEEE